MISQSDAFALAASLDLPKFSANLDPAIDWNAVHDSHGTFAMCFFDLYFHTKVKVDDMVPTVKLLVAAHDKSAQTVQTLIATTRRACTDASRACPSTQISTIHKRGRERVDCALHRRAGVPV